MAQPTIGIAFNTGTEATPVWTTIDGTEVLTFTGPDSVAGTLDPITRPTAGVRVADEMWNDEATDTQNTIYDGGGQEVADFVTDIFTSDPSNTNVLAVLVTVDTETSPGILRAWDDTNFNTTAIESLAGTTNHVESFWIAVETDSNVASSGSRTGTIPGAYLTQTANTTTYKLEGTTFELVFSTAVASGNCNVFLLHLLIPDDATNPAEAARTIELTYHYFYT